jgi:isopenicillin N synthase-like dioxygenase
MNNIPVIDFDNVGTSNKNVLKCLHEYGILIVKGTPEIVDINNKFLDMMEKYADLPLEEKMKHVNRKLHYQIGLTPEFIEKPRDRCDTVYKLNAMKPTGFDPKTRWFHRMTPIEENTEYSDISGENVIPTQIPEWENTFNKFGKYFMDILSNLNKIVSVELNQPKDFLDNLCYNGNHMMSPTMSNLKEYGKKDTILAGFHSDISLFTIHGKSRYSGLNIWTRDLQKIRVSVPPGCFLVQAGKQLAYLTGGYILDGFHEVVVGDDTVNQIKLAKLNGNSLTRVSSTFFAHVNSDKYLEVLPQFQTIENLKIYPKVKEGEWLRNRLQKLMH